MLSMNRISILIYLSVQSRRCACLYAMRLPVSQQQTLILHSRQNSRCGGPRVYLVKHKAECIGCLLFFFYSEGFQGARRVFAPRKVHLSKHQKFAILHGLVEF